MRWYEKIINAHLAVTDQVSHSERMKSKRYFVWQEDGRNDFVVGGAHVECAITGTTDLFTPMEFDPWADQLGEALTNMSIAWTIKSVQYEPDCGMYHTEWSWEVVDGKICV